MAEEKDDGRDPREVAGLCKAIPKRNLGALLHERRGMVTEFADAMGVSHETVSRWIKGTRRMDDSQIAKASWLLVVHPLYLLDMAYEADQSIVYFEYEDESLSRPRESMAEAVGSLSIPVNGRYDAHLHRWETLVGFEGGPAETEQMLVYAHSYFESESEYVPMSAEEAEDTRKEAIGSLVAIDGDFRNLSGVMFAMLAIILSTADDGYCAAAFSDLLKMFESSAYTKETNHPTIEDVTHEYRLGDGNAMHDARARLASGRRPPEEW